MPPSPLPPFTAGHHPSTSTSQTVPEDRIGALAPAQSHEPIPTTPQGVHAFTGAHSFTGENLDVAVAGGNLTRVVERHSHTHFHLNSQWILGGGALAGEGKLGPPVVSDGHFLLYVLLNGILLVLLIRPRGFVYRKSLGLIRRRFVWYLLGHTPRLTLTTKSSPARGNPFVSIRRTLFLIVLFAFLRSLW
ncbi:hypothetical protein FA13DRAFT_1742600 [Coprinellus micaceus]|uniref:Uncharacterized protein n=1 Tax=Coprinellus micaceus TaxID=71717 RepID=A0A4Y7SG78_COPMI|nr:hypothetical protein FA13DRAFT_1742600 [Coprinellus micaceus]